jgi:hypothetical protein
MTRQARVLWKFLRRRGFAAVAGQVVAAVSVVGVTLSAQAPAPAPAAQHTKPARPAAPFVPPKTPWGDPDLQGTYTNKDENGIPMERPGQFAGKAVDDLDDSEFAEIIRERQQRALASAAGIGGADTGAGPVHWYEHYNAKNSRLAHHRSC